MGSSTQRDGLVAFDMFREANICANILDNKGNLRGFQWTILDSILAKLRLAIDDDMRGVLAPRIVR